MRKLPLALALALVADSAVAAQIRVDFSGTVVQVTGTSEVSDPEAAIGGTIHPGTAFSGYFTLDDAAAPAFGYPEDPFSPEDSVYQFASPTWAFHSELGGLVTDVNSPDSDFPLGGYTLSVADFEASASPPFASSITLTGKVADLPTYYPAALVLWNVSLELVGSAPGLPLHGTSLTGVPWSVATFPQNLMQWSFDDGDVSSVVVAGQLSSLAVTVPEPGETALLAVALAALFGRLVPPRSKSIHLSARA